jgi:F-type H+-transporting ATPase subunit b
MEIFKSFGIDGIAVAAQIVNFLVILFILRRFVYKPMFKIFKQREDLAKKSIADEEASKKLLAKTQEQEKETLKKAQVTATQIIKDAREQSADMLVQAEEKTRKQTEEMIMEAREQITRETQAAQEKLTGYVSKLSVELLKKSLSSAFTPDEQSSIVKRAVKELQTKTN